MSILDVLLLASGYTVSARPLCCSALAVAAAQDPAPGWVAYARALSPTGTGRISYIEGYWTVPAAAKRSAAFYSPWFGIDTSDNLNLLQPVNPWVGNSWQIYNGTLSWEGWDWSC